MVDVGLGKWQQIAQGRRYARGARLAAPVGEVERAGNPRPSPFVIAFGSFDAFVNYILNGYLNGTYDQNDMFAVAAALRNWETDGTWAQAYER